MTTTVVEINEKNPLPKLQNLVVLSGIPTRERAKAWGEKNGYPVVYFSRRAERVYAARKYAPGSYEAYKAGEDVLDPRD